jgi:hypothetical protein
MDPITTPQSLFETCKEMDEVNRSASLIYGKSRGYVKDAGCDTQTLM